MSGVENNDFGSSDEIEKSKDDASGKEKSAASDRKYFTLLAEVQLRAWMIDDAIVSFNRAGVSPPKKDMCSLGWEAVYECQYKTAYELFRLAEAKEALIRLGNVALTMGQNRIAVDAFRAAGMQSPEYIECDDEIPVEHDLHMKVVSSTDTREPKICIARGDEALAKGDLQTAVTSYKLAGERAKLVLCGDAAFTKGWVAMALDAYKAAEVRIPDDRLVTALERLQR